MGILLVLQITLNTYTANLASVQSIISRPALAGSLRCDPSVLQGFCPSQVFTAPSTVYHGPMTVADLARSAACVPQVSQSDLDMFMKKPTVYFRGQPYGKRIAATIGRVGAIVAPATARKRDETEIDRVGLCAQMLRDAPPDKLMTILVPQSLARSFLARGNCGEFSIADGIKFTQIEAAPHFIMPFEMLRGEGREMLQSWNAVSKFVSATEQYQALEQKYLGTASSCGPATSRSSQISLYSQLGTRPACCVRLAPLKAAASDAVPAEALAWLGQVCSSSSLPSSALGSCTTPQ